MMDVYFTNTIHTNKKLGAPQISGRNARYIAPLRIGKPYGIRRIYHILEYMENKLSYEFRLGNSFILPEVRNDVTQRRAFSYKLLKEFGFIEVRPGILLNLDTI